MSADRNHRLPEPSPAPRTSARAADDIDEIRWLVEAARAACRDPDGPPAAGMIVLLDVIDDRLSALSEAVQPRALS